MHDVSIGGLHLRPQKTRVYGARSCVLTEMSPSQSANNMPLGRYLQNSHHGEMR